MWHSGAIDDGGLDPGDDARARARSRRRPPVRVRRPAVFLAGAAVASVALTGCGGGTSGSSAASGSNAPNPNAPEINAAGDIPDNQVFVVFGPPGGGYTVAVPQGWSKSTAGGATVFSDKYNSVRIESQAASQTVDVASVKATEVPKLKSSVSGFVLGDVRSVPRNGGQPVLITYQATSAANAVTGATVRLSVERYDFARNGQEVVLTLSGPKGADNVDPWRKVTDSFRWKP